MRFAEGLTPLAVEVDRFGHAAALRRARPTAPKRMLPARAILIAAGTQPNTVLAREDGRIAAGRQVFPGNRRSRRPGHARPRLPQAGNRARPDAPRRDGRFISFFGDLHPSFFGNVVKAMGSAKRGYPVVSHIMAARVPTNVAGATLIARCRDELRATVHAVNRLTPTIVEVVMHAPAAARAFRPGQFYRLQNHEMLAPRLKNRPRPHRAGAWKAWP